MTRRARGPSAAFIKIRGTRVSVNVLTLRGGQEPRLRFDRVAIGLVRRVQASLSPSVPDGKTVIVTVTAPIRQDSRTGTALEDRIRELLAARRSELTATIHGNRIRVRALDGGARGTAKLIGFVHNPTPDAALLFDVTRSMLACMGPEAQTPRGERWLVIASTEGRAPVETVRQVSLALGARTVFKRILLADGDGVSVL
jgi:hypothetical protein